MCWGARPTTTSIYKKALPCKAAHRFFFLLVLRIFSFFLFLLICCVCFLWFVFSRSVFGLLICLLFACFFFLFCLPVVFVAVFVLMLDLCINEYINIWMMYNIFMHMYPSISVPICGSCRALSHKKSGHVKNPFRTSSARVPRSLRANYTSSSLIVPSTIWKHRIVLVLSIDIVFNISINYYCHQ